MRRARSNPLLALVRLLGILASSAFILILYLSHLMTSRDRVRRFEIATRWTRCWARACAWWAGYHVAVRGALPPQGAFLAANHLGYADIIVLSGSVPMCFIAKADVRKWPFFGLLARASMQIFVSRQKSKDIQDSAGELSARLQARQTVCGFLEGTSSDGAGVLPFRSTFLQTVIDGQTPVVPVALKWSAARPGIVIGEDVAYWKPEHYFFPHLWRQLGLRGLRVEIRFGDPLASGGLNRKYLAQRAQEEVERLLAMKG